MKQYPKRGDVIIFDFSPTMGHEQSGTRPAIVLSFDVFNDEVGFVLVAPVTSKIKGHPFEVAIDTEKTFGVALAHQVRIIDFVSRKVKIVDKVSESAVLNIIKKMEAMYK
jgi:mRNA interferase MazF